MSARISLLGTLALALAAAASPSASLADVTAHASGSSVDLRGSTAMLPLAQFVSERYMDAHPGTTVMVSGGRAQRGLKALLVGTADMAMAKDELPEALAKYAVDNKIGLEKQEVYSDAVAIVVNPKNPVTNVTSKQLRDVFRGAITSWKDLGGIDAPIDLNTHESTSAAFETLKGVVLGDDAVVAPTAKTENTVEMSAAVAADERAVGYMSAHEVGQLKALTVDGVPPTARAIENGSYALHRTLCLWVRLPVTPIARAVREAFLTQEAKDFVRRLGDVPVK